jgi:hypothetical protein
VSHQLNQIRRLCQRVVWVDGGSLRMAGGTHEVVSAYESAMARVEKERGNGDKLAHGPVKGRFVHWEIMNPVGTEHHTLKHLGPVTIKVTLKVKEAMKVAMHGMALYDHDQRLVWAWASPKLRFEVGEYQLCHTFPMLPLRPGCYSWLVTLYDDLEQVDWWNCEPDMVVATESHQSHLDEWQGVLNVPDHFEIENTSISARTVKVRLDD